MGLGTAVVLATLAASSGCASSHANPEGADASVSGAAAGGGPAPAQGSDAATDASDPSCVPRTESCNNIDDDCDGRVDEGSVCAWCRKRMSSWNHTCVLLRAGEVRCWGENFYGQLGDGTKRLRHTPVAVIGLGKAIEVSAGGDHTCARLSTGQVTCWGRNHDGQLGDGTVTSRSTPVAVLGLSDTVEVAAGRWHTCARVSTGQVACWGNDGEIRPGIPTASGLATLIAGLGDAVEIAAGTWHTCARLSTGQVTCWGLNSEGQLGNGTTTASTAAPVAVQGLSDSVEIAAGGFHTCARLRATGMRCWGVNGRSRLGDGTTASRSTPVAVTAVSASVLSNSVEVAAGVEHTCVRLRAGEVKCWGGNTRGQLGDGNPFDYVPLKTSAISVSGLTLPVCPARSDGSRPE
ncbi:MAG: hypothetical protein MJD61_11220 [Proteobacteria bacterium]|nr:hypothetical protein [Pseudomonadota bacterium]